MLCSIAQLRSQHWQNLQSNKSEWK
jgi:hypothetical protein